MFIKKCPSCKIYTLKDSCSKCNKKSVNAHPRSFSLEKEKKYSKYRKIYKLKRGKTLN